MKNIFLFLLFLIACDASNAQTEKKIEVAKLVKIMESQDFSTLVKLVKYLSYEVMDSTKEADGSLIYITKELKANGNTLGCTIDAKGKMGQLNFSTSDKATYEEFKKQIKTLGFKSSGIRKGTSSELLESEDFDKGKLYMSTGAKKTGDERIEYEFTFLKF